MKPGKSSPKPWAVSLLTLTLCIFLAGKNPAQAEAPSPTEPPNSPLLAAYNTNHLGVKIYRQLHIQTSANSTPPNLCISPLSISTALAMVFAGAVGSTQHQFVDSLQYPFSDLALCQSFSQLLEQILSQSSQSSDFTLLFVSKAFGQKNFHFNQPYLQLLEQYFRAPLETADFAKNPAEATRTINLWVENHTNHKIQNLIPDSVLTEYTRLVLVNALYFLAQWNQDFDVVNEFEFQTADGKTIQVPAIRAERNFGFVETPFVHIVTIPYRNPNYQLVLLLPNSNTTLSELAERLNFDLVVQFTQTPRTKIRLTFPKVKLELPTLSLRQTLHKLDIFSAFDVPPGNANFGNIAPKTPDDYIYLQDIFHKVFLEWDEKGTEAAAATAAVMMRATAIPAEEEKPLILNFDKPFLFAIQHVPTSALLFLGQITNPTASN